MSEETPSKSVSRKLQLKRERAIQLFARSVPVQQIADQLKVSRQTLWEWRKDPDFIVPLDIARSEQNIEWQDELRSLVPLSFESLRAIIESGSATARIKAIQMVLEASQLINAPDVAIDEETEWKIELGDGPTPTPPSEKGGSV